MSEDPKMTAEEAKIIRQFLMEGVTEEIIELLKKRMPAISSFCNGGKHELHCVAQILMKTLYIQLADRLEEPQKIGEITRHAFHMMSDAHLAMERVNHELLKTTELTRKERFTPSSNDDKVST
jgi:hypothetical protein